MERITDQKFQKLNSMEMSQLKGGGKLLLHYPCAGPADGPVSVSVYQASWFERAILGKDDVYEKYDAAYNCEDLKLQPIITTPEVQFNF